MNDKKKRKRIPTDTQTETLINSRRRCCICYGINRDERAKAGQIAHLDGDNTNCKFNNLVFLCLDHHDEYDSKTSQSKGLTIEEVKIFRNELYEKFNYWSNEKSRNHLLNFLEANIDMKLMVDVAIKIASSVVYYGEEHAVFVLTTPHFQSIDADLYIPQLIVLDKYSSFGWLTFEENIFMENGIKGIDIKVNFEKICSEIAEEIKKRINRPLSR